MVDGHGLAPAFWRHGGQKVVLLLRRRHPLVCRALHCLRRDPANIELVFAALAPSIF